MDSLGPSWMNFPHAWTRGSAVRAHDEHDVEGMRFATGMPLMWKAQPRSAATQQPYSFLRHNSSQIAPTPTISSPQKDKQSQAAVYISKGRGSAMMPADGRATQTLTHIAKLHHPDLAEFTNAASRRPPTGGRAGPASSPRFWTVPPWRRRRSPTANSSQKITRHALKENKNTHTQWKHTVNQSITEPPIKASFRHGTQSFKKRLQGYEERKSRLAEDPFHNTWLLIMRVRGPLAKGGQPRSHDSLAPLWEEDMVIIHSAWAKRSSQQRNPNPIAIRRKKKKNSNDNFYYRIK